MADEAALDEEGVARKAYWITSLPTLALIDRRGGIRDVRQGYAPGTERKIRQAIEELPAEGRPAAD